MLDPIGLLKSSYQTVCDVTAKVVDAVDTAAKGLLGRYLVKKTDSTRTTPTDNPNTLETRSLKDCETISLHEVNPEDSLQHRTSVEADPDPAPYSEPDSMEMAITPQMRKNSLEAMELSKSLSVPTGTPLADTQTQEELLNSLLSVANKGTLSTPQLALTTTLTLKESLGAALGTTLELDEGLLDPQLEKDSLKQPPKPAMSEQSLQAFGEEVNEAVQKLYFNLTNFGRADHETMLQAMDALKTGAADNLTRITEKDAEVATAWLSMRDAALAVMHSADISTDTPHSPTKLKAKQEKFDRLDDDRFAANRKFNYYKDTRHLSHAGNSEKVKFFAKRKVHKLAAELAAKKAAKYHEKKVAPLKKELDNAIKDWMNESPEWQDFLKSYKDFEQTMAGKIKGYTLKNSNLVAQIRSWVFNCLLDKARNELRDANNG